MHSVPRGPFAAVTLLATTLFVVPLAATHAAKTQVNLHATIHVAIQNFAFSPQKLTVSPGTTVVWTQADNAPHTVTSDTGAWTASANLNNGQTFSHTFSKTGTYTYHCAVHPNMTASIVVSSAGASIGGTNSQNSVSAMTRALGPVSKTSIVAWTGYYDNKPGLYILTDTSSMSAAMREHINFAPALAQSLSKTNSMYLVMNGKYAGRGPVFSSWPSEKSYSPLWQEVYVTWTSPSHAVALGRDDQIKALVKSGALTLKATGTVVDGSILPLK